MTRPDTPSFGQEVPISGSVAATVDHVLDHRSGRHLIGSWRHDLLVRQRVPKRRTLQVFGGYKICYGIGEWTQTTDLLITNKLLHRPLLFGVLLIYDAYIKGGCGMGRWPPFRPISAERGSTRSRGDKRSTARRHAGVRIAQHFGEFHVRRSDGSGPMRNLISDRTKTLELVGHYARPVFCTIRDLIVGNDENGNGGEQFFPVHICV